MNNEEEVWVSDPKHVCLIAKLNGITNQLQIGSQGILEIDSEIEIRAIDEKSNIKVDPLSKVGASDLLTLNELNEFNSLHGVRVRYYKEQIYTQVGIPILIAVNPYKNLDIYGDKTIKFYKTSMAKLKSINKESLQVELRKIEPHLFKMAQMSLDQLFEKNSKSLRICSMIISGESGSGKTESTKKILKYLAKESTSGLFTTIPSKTSIEEQVFASNPLLEAFGNAKTARNDNSSRFGKFIHLYFNAVTQKIMSAKIDNYLLEKSRVVKISPVERNYHIFYQLLASQIPELKLTTQKNYKYLKDGDLAFAPQNEAQDFKETSECLNKMNFTAEEKLNIFKIVAGILHLGNTQIVGDANSSSFIEDLAFSNAQQMLGIQDLDRIICHRLTIFGKQEILKDNSLAQAVSARDSLAKYIYNKLFDWLIRKVNEALHVEVENNYMIGILDIFGFEIFEDYQRVHCNSFEQLNINFTNEKLQQHFNSHMLETEQIEYNAERIEWAHIKFPDNKAIIDLIENPKNGIFRSLNDQCFAPNGNDDAFLAKLKTCPPEFILFKDALNNLDPRVDKKAHQFAKFGWFGVKHFAGDVIYNIDGFVDKNKDQINMEVHTLMAQSENPVVQQIQKDSKVNTQKHGQNNVLTFFQEQLKELLTLLNKSLPQYIRCIKPNNQKEFAFDAIEVRRQMRCAGLLEAIQIRKAGYEIRVLHNEFVKKYRYLGKGKIQNIEQMFKSMFLNEQIKLRMQFEFQKKNIQIGVTKIFMKEVFRDYLDQLLIEYRMKFLIRIQKAAKIYIFKKTIFKNLKALLQKLHKIAKWMKRFLFKKMLNRRIKIRQGLNLVTKYLNRKSLIKNFNQLLKWNQERKEEARQRQLQAQIDAENLKRAQQQQNQAEAINQVEIRQIQSYGGGQKSSLMQSTQLVDQSMRQSGVSLRETQSNNNFSRFTEIISKLEIQLKEEKNRRMEVEEKVQQQEREIMHLLEQGSRETVNAGNVGGLLETIMLDNLTKQKAQLEVELEQLKSETQLNEKKYNRKIEELNRQLAQVSNQEEIQNLEEQIEHMTNEYFKCKSDIDTINVQWEEKIQKLKEQHRQELEQQANKYKSDIIKLQSSGASAELEKEKKKRIELEAENQKYKQMYEYYKQRVESEEVEIISAPNNDLQHQNEIKQLNDKLQSKDLIIQQLKDQIRDLTLKQQQIKPAANHSNEELQKLQDTLKQREQSHMLQKKLTSNMNNLIKLKIIEVHTLHKYFKVDESNKAIIYKDIAPQMSKETILMQRFEQLLNEIRSLDPQHQETSFTQ